MKMKSYHTRVSPKSDMLGVLIRIGNLDTDTQGEQHGMEQADTEVL